MTSEVAGLLIGTRVGRASERDVSPPRRGDVKSRSTFRSPDGVTAPRHGTDGQAHLTNRPIPDKTLTLARAMEKDPLHGKGPVFRTLREIAALPEADRFDAFVDRLDLLDADEVAKVVKNQKGEVMYAATSNKVRLSILEVGKQWLVDEQAKGNRGGAGKLAALSVFNGQRKAG